MSSWDRSRHIPWTRATQPGPPPGTIRDTSAEEVDISTAKERIFRDLAREAAQEEAEERKLKKQQNPSSSSPETTSVTLQRRPSAAQSLIQHSIWEPHGVPYTTPDLFRNATFGVTLGSITGMVFGFMDGMRNIQDKNAALAKASNAAKGKYMFQGTVRSGMVFGAFFGSFHAIKYGIRVMSDPGDVAEVSIAGAITLGGLVVKPATRASLPYAGMLIAMDTFHIYMRD
mmetsp:Transcript_5444/g.8058  ORF Transcript_5444/g.8058 Transcript_5444/m.8058 type:complete len:229 (-) Transcript_5444:133-819(-)